MRGVSVEWTGEKMVKFAQEDDKRDNHSRRCALLNTEAVREKLQQFDDIFRMMLDVQKSYNSLLPPAEQQRDEEWFDDFDHNICSFKQKIQSWIKDAEAERQAQLSSKQSVSTNASSQSRSSGRSSSKASSRSSRQKRALEERIKMAELIAEAEYMENKPLNPWTKIDSHKLKTYVYNLTPFDPLTAHKIYILIKQLLNQFEGLLVF